jgi:hypothetical protein
MTSELAKGICAGIKIMPDKRCQKKDYAGIDVSAG